MPRSATRWPATKVAAVAVAIDRAADIDGVDSHSATFTDQGMSHMTQEACFGFRGRPFQAAPQDELFVPLEPTVDAIEQLVKAAETGDGIGVLTAVAGAGKTVVCREAKARLDQEFFTVLLASCSFPTRRAMLQSILYEMGCEYARLSEQESHLQLLQSAQSLLPQHQGLVIIADEAHQLSARLLEELRCLTNHVEQGRPLIRVLVSGQLELEELLTTPQLQSLNYRITCHATLEPLTLRQSARYLEERLKHVGGDVGRLFSAEALEAICRISDGNPRCLNQLADACLTFASEDGEVPIPASTVRVVLRDLRQLPLQWNESVCDELSDDEDAALPASYQFERPTDRELSPSEEQDAANREHVRETQMQSESKLSEEPTWMSQVVSIEVGAEEEQGVDAESTSENVSSHADGLVISESGASDRPTRSTHVGLESASQESSVPAGPNLLQAEVEAVAPSIPAHDATSVELREWEVEDRYAALDRDNAGVLATVDDVTSIEWHDSLTAANPATPHHSEDSDHEPFEAERSDLVNLPTIDDGEHTEVRIDRVIQVVSEAVATEMARHLPVEQLSGLESKHRQQRADARKGQWRAAPVADAFDLVDPPPNEGPGERPQSLTDAATAANHPTMASEAAAFPTDESGQGKFDAELRPYARLFSQARRLRIRA